MKVEFFRHNLSNADKQEVLKVLDSIFLTTGEWTKKFEEKLSIYTGNQFAIGLTSCTQALELALKYYGIGPGDEVLTTPLSFIATANAAEYVGAKPVFVDVEAQTGNIDANLVEKYITKKTKAILPVHLYGQMCDMRQLKALAEKYNLRIIEDAAHCLEGSRDGVRVGEMGDIACFSFYATKNLTSGEGGAITCHDQAVHDWLKKASLHGMSKNAADRYTKKYEHYDMEFLGYKCNMTNISAALLVNQIDHIEEYRQKRQKVYEQYEKGFASNKYIGRPAVLSDSRHSHHLYTIWVKPAKRDEYMEAIQKEGIGIGVNFRPIHLMKYYKEKYGYRGGEFPAAEKIGGSTITLPLYPSLREEEVNYVVETVNKIVKE